MPSVRPHAAPFVCPAPVIASLAGVLLLVCLLAPSSYAQEDLVERRTLAGAEDADRGLALTVSGGVSKGSYQGGFGYGLTYVMRLSRETPDVTPSYTLPAYHLVSATGASAGNINALLAAVSWCDADFLQRGPQQSAFWRIWIPVGIEQLFPENRPKEPTLPELVFSRQFFFTEIEPRLTATMRRPARDNCEVPIGLTLTRIDRLGTVELSPDVPPVRTIRYASIARLTTSGSDAPAMRFRPFNFSGLDTQQYGALLLPDLSDQDDPLGVNAMVRVALGSSAFPVAFAPVPIPFTDGPRGDRVDGLFIDGGVFDNHPLGLSDALYNPRLDDTPPNGDNDLRMPVRRSTNGGDSLDVLPVYSLLVNQNNRRPATVDDSLAALTVRDRQPISTRVYGSFLEKAITTAREYELELLARELTEDERQRIEQSSRFHAFTSESLQSFGGFFSFLFRQHDFYVGVYDALYFIATQGDGDENVSDPDVLAPRVRALIDRMEPQLDPDAVAFLRFLHEGEFGTPPTCTPFDENGNLYISIACAAQQWEDTVGPANTGGIDAVKVLFASLNDYIAPDTFLSLEADACRAEATTAANPTPADDDPTGAFRCGVIQTDGLLKQLRDNPSRTLRESLESALEILRKNEYAVKDTEDETSAKTYITLAYFLERNVAMQTRAGFSWDSSSMPVERRKRRGLDASLVSTRLIWRILAPNEAVFPVARRGWGVSYRPTFFPGRRYAPRIPLLLGYNKYEGEPGLFQAGIGLRQPVFSGLRSLLLHSVEVGVAQGVATTGVGVGLDYTGVNTGAYLLGGKVRVGVLWPAAIRSGAGDRYGEYQVSLGVSDLNGLLYWVGEFIR